MVCCKMEVQLGPVKRRARDVALLDGSAFSSLSRMLRRGLLPEIHETVRPLRIFAARPLDVFDENDVSYFAVDCAALGERLHSYSFVIVDVSPDSKPKVLPGSCTEYKVAKARILSCIDSLATAESTSAETPLPLLPDGHLDSVILGILLGYPVVYMSRTPSSNCLSDEPLVLFSIGEANTNWFFTAFSVPSCLLNDKDVAHILTEWRCAAEKRGLIIQESFVRLPTISL